MLETLEVYVFSSAEKIDYGSSGGLEAVSLDDRSPINSGG
jgi:hypothetical protein